MDILLIRHGKTKGNLGRRYVGRTDEPLCKEAVRELSLADYVRFAPDIVYSSSMLRCVQTAKILFPGRKIKNCPGLREMDFGKLEYKTHEEMKGDKDYQRWIESAGKAEIPGAETGGAFRARCRDAFKECLLDASVKAAKSAAFVVHGGTIMAVMEAFADPPGEYYSFQVPNGGGYAAKAEVFGPKVRIYDYVRLDLKL